MEQLSTLSQKMFEVEQEYGISVGDFVCWKNNVSVGHVRAIVPAHENPLRCYPYLKIENNPNVVDTVLSYYPYLGDKEASSLNVTLTFSSLGARVLIQRPKNTMQPKLRKILSEWLVVPIESVHICDASEITQEAEAG